MRAPGRVVAVAASPIVGDRERMGASWFDAFLAKLIGI
jgi:hypothetical protein